MIQTKKQGFPAFGVITLWNKVFFVTYLNEDDCQRHLKLVFSTARGKIKDMLKTTNKDIQATDNDEMSWKNVLKHKPEH